MQFARKMRLVMSPMLLGAVMAVGLAQQPATAALVTVVGPSATEVDKIAGTIHNAITVDEGFIIDLTVSVRLESVGGSTPETFWGDLDMFIIHNGIKAQLLDFDDPFDCCNFELFDVIFDDSATSVLGTTTAIGTFKPQNGFLSAFDGQLFGGPSGLWQLLIFDRAFAENETDLVSWSVTANVALIPLPAALPLFLTGLAGLGLMRRRKRQALRN